MEISSIRFKVPEVCQLYDQFHESLDMNWNLVEIDVPTLLQHRKRI